MADRPNLGDQETIDRYLRWHSLKVGDGVFSFDGQVDQFFRDDANQNGTIYSYNYRAKHGVALSTAEWEVMRFTHINAGDSSDVIQILVRSGIAADDRVAGTPSDQGAW